MIYHLFWEVLLALTTIHSKRVRVKYVENTLICLVHNDTSFSIHQTFTCHSFHTFFCVFSQNNSNEIAPNLSGWLALVLLWIWEMSDNLNLTEWDQGVTQSVVTVIIPQGSVGNIGHWSSVLHYIQLVNTFSDSIVFAPHNYPVHSQPEGGTSDHALLIWGFKRCGNAGFRPKLWIIHAHSYNNPFKGIDLVLNGFYQLVCSIWDSLASSQKEKKIFLLTNCTLPAHVQVLPFLSSHGWKRSVLLMRSSLFSIQYQYSIWFIRQFKNWYTYLHVKISNDTSEFIHIINQDRTYRIKDPWRNLIILWELHTIRELRRWKTMITAFDFENEQNETQKLCNTEQQIKFLSIAREHSTTYNILQSHGIVWWV